MSALAVNGVTITKEHIAERMEQYGLPEYMAGGMFRYLAHHIGPGRFMQAVLSNDLCGAVGGADTNNGARLKEWVQFCYQELPTNCWGSHEAVQDWIKKRVVD